MQIQIENPFYSRAMSSWPISIGTALALESFFLGPNPVYDPERVIPNQINIEDYQEFWVNLGTLFRNIMGSVSAIEKDKAMPADVLAVLESEAESIDEIVTEKTNGSVKVQYYSCMHDDLASEHPHAKLRLLIQKTPKQEAYEHTQELVLAEFHKRHGQQEQVHLFKKNLRPGNKTKAILLSHDALDLLSEPNFTTLHLLESHTGILKRRALWHTKFNNGKELSRIPFNAAFLQIFGDSQHFQPFPIAVRKRIISLAEEYKWTWTTTMDRITLCVELLEDPALSKQIKEMLKEK